MFSYRVFTSEKALSDSRVPKTFICTFEKPVHEFLDDNKPYIILADGHTVMKHSITYIQDITNGDMGV